MSVRSVTALIILFILSGCTAVLKEVRYPGGYAGYLLDNRTFDASKSKQLQLFRSTLILAMSSRMATATIRDPKDANAFVEYLSAAADEINYTAADIYTANDGTEPCKIRFQQQPLARKCYGYSVNFESDMPLVGERLFNVTLAALPKERARQFLDDVSSGNVLGAAWSAVRSAGKMLSGLQRATGVYRSGLESVAIALCEVKADNSQQELYSLRDAVTCLGLSEESIFDNPNEREIGKLLISRDAFDAVMSTARTACSRLPLASDVNLVNSVSKRNEYCGKLDFSPKERPNVLSTSG